MEDGKNVMPEVADSTGMIGMVELSAGSGRSVADGIGSSVMVAEPDGSEVTMSVG